MSIVRWGGEEFAIILPETDKNGALTFVKHIRMLVERSSCRYKITICIGVTTVYQEHDAEKIMSIVDRALYKAKENKNMVVFLRNNRKRRAFMVRLFLWLVTVL